ncbi:hypothetical protein [Actinopolymorpha alba]|uniref:hypothetical protein n=1 Tax=Actinopolymorpha alba TaxID=533267 RepID=UPI0003A3968F|nr:hypothetical protein [Actinopolymorpha alba]
MPVLNAADLLVFPVLLRDHAITDLVRTVLGQLTEARGGPQPFLDTLAAFFESQGNITATARRRSSAPDFSTGPRPLSDPLPPFGNVALA